MSVHTIDYGSEITKIMEATIGISKTSWKNQDLNKILIGDFEGEDIKITLKESVVTILERINFLKEQNNENLEKCINLAHYLVKREKESNNCYELNLIATNIEEFYPLGAFICISRCW
jgi:hypothetical protein